MKDLKIKPSFNEERSVLGKVLPLQTPYTILIDVSDMCNLRCKYCFRAENSEIEAPDYKKNELMSWETFLRIVEQMREFPNPFKRISFSHHGEPLCNKLLPKMIKYIKEQGIEGKCEFHTNGILLTEAVINELVEAEVDRIIISLQGMTEKKYLSIANANINIDEFYHNIEYFYKRKRNTVINIKVVDAALDKGEELLFCEKYGKVADRIFIEKVVPLWDRVERMNETNNKYGGIYKWQECCPLAFYTINVLASGKIYPCSHILPPFELGTVYSTRLLDAWNSNERKNFLIKQLYEGRGEDSWCRGCYVPQNTVLTKADSIDKYRKEILHRMEQSK